MGLTNKPPHDRIGAMEKNNIANLIPNAEVFLDNGMNVLLIGNHGTGKTASIMELAEAKGINVKYFSCSTLDPYTDFVGVPTPRFYCKKDNHYQKDSDVCEMCNGQMIEALKMVRPHEIDEAELIFFDEFNRADTKVLNAIFEIIQFGSINGEKLPNLKACWAAMNPPDEDFGYQVEDVDPALMDRFDAFVEITPRPSVSYMSQFMPEEIARALKMWWDEHGRTQGKNKEGKKDRMDYVSPRRLVKIGLVYMASGGNATATKMALHPGGNFDKTKLMDLLRAATADMAKRENGGGLGDAPAYFDYNAPAMLSRRKEIITHLKDNPSNLETHNKVADALRAGAGGAALVEIWGEMLEALNPAVLESFIASLPDIKRGQMRLGYKSLYQKNREAAESYQNLYTILGRNADQASWPQITFPEKKVKK